MDQQKFKKQKEKEKKKGKSAKDTGLDETATVKCNLIQDKTQPDKSSFCPKSLWGSLGAWSSPLNLLFTSSPLETEVMM